MAVAALSRHYPAIRSSAVATGPGPGPVSGVRLQAGDMWPLVMVTLSLRGLAVTGRAYLDTSLAFRPSVQLGPLNTSASRVEDRRSITFETDLKLLDLGNIDYTDTGAAGREAGGGHDERLYYDTFTPEDVRHTFVPSSAAPPAPPPRDSPAPDVEIVVKGLPGAGPRLTGAKTTFNPPHYHRHHDYSSYHTWAPPRDRPICDDKVSY